MSKKVTLVVTDDNKDYNYIHRDMKHESVNHSKNEWVRGSVHTNSIESFWSLIKRGVVGPRFKEISAVLFERIQLSL